MNETDREKAISLFLDATDTRLSEGPETLPEDVCNAQSANQSVKGFSSLAADQKVLGR